MNLAAGGTTSSGQTIPATPLLVTAVGDGPAAQTLLAAVHRAGASVVAALDEGSSILQKDPGARLMVLYQNPACELAARLEDESAGVSLQGWMETARRLLDTFRRCRTRTILVDADAALASPALLAAEFSNRLGLDLEVPLQKPEVGNGSPERIRRVLATAMLRADGRVAALLDELQASTVPMPEPDPVDAECLAAAWREVVEKPQKLLSDARAESELLQLQLNQVQEELESYCSANARLEEEQQEAAGLRKELQSYRSTNEKLEEEQRESVRALDELRQQLYLMQEDLETYHLANRGLEEELRQASGDIGALHRRIERLQEENASLRATVTAIRASKSWALTAPLRKGLDLIAVGDRGSQG